MNIYSVSLVGKMIHFAHLHGIDVVVIFSRLATINHNNGQIICSLTIQHFEFK